MDIKQIVLDLCAFFIQSKLRGRSIKQGVYFVDIGKGTFGNN